MNEDGDGDSDGDTTEENIRKDNTLQPRIEIVLAESIFPQSETIYESEMNSTKYFKKNLEGLRNNINEENDLDIFKFQLLLEFSYTL